MSQGLHAVRWSYPKFVIDAADCGIAPVHWFLRSCFSAVALLHCSIVKYLSMVSLYQIHLMLLPRQAQEDNALEVSGKQWLAARPCEAPPPLRPLCKVLHDSAEPAHCSRHAEAHAAKGCRRRQPAPPAAATLPAHQSWPGGSRTKGIGLCTCTASGECNLHLGQAFPDM